MGRGVGLDPDRRHADRLVLAERHAGGRGMRERAVADLAALPLHGRLSSSVTWWGTLSFMLIEGTGFGLVLVIYFYLASLATEWPIGAPPPDLGPGTIVTLILLVSAVPNWLVMRWAKRKRVALVRIGILVM